MRQYVAEGVIPYGTHEGNVPRHAGLPEGIVPAHSWSGFDAPPDGKCVGTKKDGTQCTAPSLTDGELCVGHARSAAANKSSK